MIAVQVLSHEYQQFLQKCQSLNLEPIAYQLMRSKSGPHWTQQQTIKAISRYLSFLYLAHCYPRIPLVPSYDIDQIWHYHISDTVKYAEDCQFLFGRFIHHFSYFGVCGETDRQNLLRTYALTQVLFRKHFGEELAINDVAD